MIRVIFPQGWSDEENSTREKEVKGKSRHIARRWERKRPCCFDDFSRRGNVPRLRGRFVASRASGPISHATRYIESHRETTPLLHNNMNDRRKSDGRKSAIIYHSCRSRTLFFFVFEKHLNDNICDCFRSFNFFKINSEREERLIYMNYLKIDKTCVSNWPFVTYTNYK